MNVRLHIERLVLEGMDVSPSERPLLQAALETELGRLLATGGVSSDLQGGIAVPSVRAGGIEMQQAGGAERLGQQIAHAVYQGVGR
jgi:hypothetical protein